MRTLQLQLFCHSPSHYDEFYKLESCFLLRWFYLAGDYIHTEPDDVLKVLPERKAEAHKGDYGRLLVVGGGLDYVGAPALVALAALRTGVDLAIVAAPEKTAWAINSISPDLITIKLPGRKFGPSAVPELDKHLKRATAVVVGPGLGMSSETRKGVIELTKKLAESYPQLPAIFDADGLKVLATKRELLRNPNWVVTPHAGEFELLTGLNLPAADDQRAKQVRAAAKDLGCVVLLKTGVDIISAPDGRCALNRTGNPGMTVGGTGDVLAGIVGAFLAQGVEAFQSAVAGAFLCGYAGDLCLQDMGYEFVASDLIKKLPLALAKIRRSEGITIGKVQGS